MARYIVYLKSTKAFKFYHKRERVIELASELAGHPAFSNIFVIDNRQDGVEYPLATFLVEEVRHERNKHKVT
jgi:hypothetical protein